MKKILVLMLALIVLAGCAAQQGPDESAAREAAKAAETPVGDKIVKAPSTVISAELRDEIESALVKGVKFSMPLNYRKMEYGDSFVFGVGVQNVKTKQYEFSVDVTFKKAYDRMTNSISVDDDLMNSWIKSTIGPFDLDQNQKNVVSVRIEAGDIRPGIEAAPGTYVFDVKSYSREHDNVVRDAYANAEFSVNIE